jgi:hypothetical protein
MSFDLDVHHAVAAGDLNQARNMSAFILAVWGAALMPWTSPRRRSDDPAWCRAGGLPGPWWRVVAADDLPGRFLLLTLAGGMTFPGRPEAVFDNVFTVN